MKLITRYLLVVLCTLLAGSARAQTATNDLFVASFSTGRVTRLDGTTGATVYEVPERAFTINLAKGPDGALYVTTLANAVIRVDLETGLLTGVFTSGGNLRTSVGIAFGPDGNLYVGDRDANAVLRYDGLTGEFIDVFVPSGSGGLSSTEALAFGPDGNLYVTEFYGNRVLRYDGVAGDFLGVFATDPNLRGTRSMIFGPDGDLYVAGNFSNNVVRFDGVTGAYKSIWIWGVSAPNGLAFGPDGNIYVASESTNKIIRYSGSTGVFLNDFATVTGPIGLFFDIAPAVPAAAATH